MVLVDGERRLCPYWWKCLMNPEPSRYKDELLKKQRIGEK